MGRTTRIPIPHKGRAGFYGGMQENKKRAISGQHHMRVAVLVSERIQKVNPIGDFIKNNKRLKFKFPGADFYYGTCKSYKSEFKRLFPNETCEYFDEPTMLYHSNKIDKK